uniref:Uncharacterized protein n=1 Tax=Attheya septentrionalis TaxID=420275 RepID=A0A7S2XKB6_9STRA|mmetsp:Transcript_16705/g.30380  ORF Transcript_16705/g.30380 Transcript_16705/m.30380 type:complete len:144 (+) Transcript_16705:355-786(+)
MSQSRRNEHQQVYLRQATILRKNLYEWDRIIRDPRGEDWPSMLGRLNAALNQTGNLDGAIEDVLEHFVYEPRKCTANPQDIPFFLSTRLTTVDTVPDETSKTNAKVDQVYESTEESDPAKVLKRYENRAAELAAEFEESMVRF